MKLTNEQVELLREAGRGDGLVPMGKYGKSILNNMVSGGFICVTPLFPAGSKYTISDYGRDYLKKLDTQYDDQIEEIRQAVEKLAEVLSVVATHSKGCSFTIGSIRSDIAKIFNHLARAKR